MVKKWTGAKGPGPDHAKKKKLEGRRRAEKNWPSDSFGSPCKTHMEPKEEAKQLVRQGIQGDLREGSDQRLKDEGRSQGKQLTVHVGGRAGTS